MYINFITKVGDCAYQAQRLLQTGPGDSPLATPTIALWNPDSAALPSDPRGLLAWIVGGGGAWLLAEVLLSEVLSKWDWFETSLSASGKRLRKKGRRQVLDRFRCTSQGGGALRGVETVRRGADKPDSHRVDSAARGSGELLLLPRFRGIGQR